MLSYPKTPLAKPRMTRADTWKKRPVVLKYWAYKDDIKAWARKNDFKLGCEIFCKFYIPMPKSWSKKKKEKFAGSYHQSRPDVDNLLKGLMDALLEEDSHVYSVVSQKLWDYEGRIEFYKLANISLS
jgi:Holliday junction resolvase RusA-like endonuclease